MAKSPTYARRHYVQVAHILAAHETPAGIVTAFVTAFAADNPRFNEDRFRDACSPEDEIKRLAESDKNWSRIKDESSATSPAYKTARNSLYHNARRRKVLEAGS